MSKNALRETEENSKHECPGDYGSKGRGFESFRARHKKAWSREVSRLFTFAAKSCKIIGVVPMGPQEKVANRGPCSLLGLGFSEGRHPSHGDPSFGGAGSLPAGTGAGIAGPLRWFHQVEPPRQRPGEHRPGAGVYVLPRLVAPSAQNSGRFCRLLSGSPSATPLSVWRPLRAAPTITPAS